MVHNNVPENRGKKTGWWAKQRDSSHPHHPLFTCLIFSHSSLIERADTQEVTSQTTGRSPSTGLGPVLYVRIEGRKGGAARSLPELKGARAHTNAHMLQFV